MKIKLEDFNYYGFNHAEVIKRFEGSLTYVGTFCVNDEYMPVAVYHSANPDRSKSHKDYLLLTTIDRNLYVRGMDSDYMEKWRVQDAVRCSSCEDVVYSVMRHDFHSCSCGEVSIDGGRDYTKIGLGGNAIAMQGTVDLLTGEFFPD